MAEKLKAMSSHARFKHFQLLSVFYAFSVCLMFANINTDFNTASEFFERGDTYWGAFTLIPVFAPFLVQLIMNLIGYCQCYKFEKWELTSAIHLYLPTTVKKGSKYSQWKQEFKLLLWHFPICQPIRLVKFV